MIEIGEKQKLVVVEKADMGLYLSKKGDESEKVLLLNRHVPEDTKLGDSIDVFVYKDSEDRPIATTETPELMINEVGVLEVDSVTDIGAFLDWGLPKDLFLPFKEQTTEVEEGKKYLVGIYLDKSERLCATMRVNTFLRVDSPYKEDDKVRGTVYNIVDEIGAFVAVDEKFEGLIPKTELSDELRVGDKVDARVTKVKEDGRLDLSIKKKAYKQMRDDSEVISNLLEESGGEIKLNDKSSPDEIKKLTGLSKNAFKRAVGSLLKRGKIEFTEDGIKEK